MLDVRYSAKFKKDYKNVLKRGYNPDLLEKIIDMLRSEVPLSTNYHDHELAGNYTGYRECHITSDWLLIYKVERQILTLTLTRTGSHSDLF